MNLTIRLTTTRLKLRLTHLRRLLAPLNISCWKSNVEAETMTPADKGGEIRSERKWKKSWWSLATGHLYFNLAAGAAINGSSCRASRKMPNCTMPEIIIRQLRKLPKGLKPFPRRRRSCESASRQRYANAVAMNFYWRADEAGTRVWHRQLLWNMKQYDIRNMK